MSAGCRRVWRDVSSPSRCRAACDSEREHAAESVAQVLLRQRVRRMVCQARITDPRDFRLRLQRARELERVAGVPLHSKRQRFQSLQKQERVERTERRPVVAQTFDACTDDERDVPELRLRSEEVVEVEAVNRPARES